MYTTCKIVAPRSFLVTVVPAVLDFPGFTPPCTTTRASSAAPRAPRQSLSPADQTFKQQLLAELHRLAEIRTETTPQSALTPKATRKRLSREDLAYKRKLLTELYRLAKIPW